MNKESWLYPTKQMRVGGIEWEYVSQGTGKDCLLIFPGGGQTAQGNHDLIAAFEDRYKVIVPTIYEANSIADFTEAVNSILDKEKTNSLIVYGLSLGGLLAQSYIRKNLDRSKALILSHACTPESRNYHDKIIRPLILLNFLMPFIPDYAIRKAGSLSSMLQKTPKHKDPDQLIPGMQERNMYFAEDFQNRFFNKKLLTTWIKLHLDFFKHEHYSAVDLRTWGGKVLIMQTDNDPLMRDEGYFEQIYPTAQRFTFQGTGHATYYYQFKRMIGVMKQFLDTVG